MLKPSVKLNRLEAKYKKDKDAIMDEIVESISEQIKHKNTNISKMCRDLDLSRTMFYNILDRKRVANSDILDDICKYIGLIG